MKCEPQKLSRTRPRRSKAEADLLRDSRRAARAAKLRYINGPEPGFARRARGKGFDYVDAKGRLVRDEQTLTRISKLGIPPAWKDVWICRSANGHLQATGIDARGRKQYRYHPAWRLLRDQAKYQDILPFVSALPTLRRKVQRDLAKPDLPREKVLAAIVSLMDRTQLRVGNERYAKDNGSFGLTTLLDEHVKIHGDLLDLQFRGKSGKLLHAKLKDRVLARVVKRCRDVPGQRLFQYLDEHGEAHSVTSTDVNRYIREATGQPFTAKEFRTWAATLMATVHLSRCEPCKSPTAARRIVKQAAEGVAQQLGNTVAICKKCYIDPRVLDHYVRGELKTKFEVHLAQSQNKHGLSRAEVAVSAFLTAIAA